MAKKKTSRRRRRSDEELIQDLQERISPIQTRAAARQLKKTPQIKATISALKALDKALEVAEEEEDTLLRHILGDGRKPIVDYLETQGFEAPKVNLPRGRRPKME